MRTRVVGAAALPGALLRRHDPLGESLRGVQVGVRDVGGVERDAMDLPGEDPPLLTDVEKEAAVSLACEAGATYLKNASSGQVEVANPESIRYLVERAPEGVLVKASGGIRDAATALAMVEAGATRLGCSSSRAILDGLD